MTIASLSLLLVILWTLLGYFLMPLPLDDRFFAWLHRQWLLEGVAIFAALGAISIAIASRRNAQAPRIPWWNAWGIWMIWAAVSVVYSIDRGMSLRGWLAFASYGLLAYAACRLVRTSADVLRWTRCLVWIAIVVSVQGLVQYVSAFDDTLSLMERLRASGELNFQGWGAEVIKDFLTRKRIFSVFGWPNLFAGFLLLMLPLAMSLSLHGPRRLSRIGWAFASLLLGACLVLTLSMGAWIAAVLTGCLTWWLVHRPASKASAVTSRLKPKLAHVLIAGIAISGLLCVTSFILAKRARPLIQASTTSRLVYVQGAWNVLRAAPVRGTGLGTFGLAYWSLLPPRYAGGQHSALHAHNTVLEIGAELGAVGIACFLFFLWKLWPLVLLNTTRQPSGTLRWLRCGLAVGVLGFFIHTLLEQTFFETVTAPFWWIAVGFLTGASGVGREESPLLTISNRRFGILGLPLAMGCVTIGLTLWLAVGDVWAGRAAFLDHAGRSQEALEAFQRAQHWNPVESRYPFEAGERLLARVQQLASAEATGALTNAQQQFTRSVLRSPWWGYAWMRLGIVQWQLGHTNEALHAMRQAVQRDPNLTEALTHLASMLHATGQFAPLLEIAQRLQQRDARGVQGSFFEALAWEGLRRPANAIHTYRSILERNPSYYPAWFNLAEVLRRQGDDRGAAAAYRAFLDTAPQDDAVQRRMASAFIDARTKKYP